MPVWTVQIADGATETVQAPLLATESGSLLAVSEEGLLLRAWAPGHWHTVRCVDGAQPCPMGPADGAISIWPRSPRR